ncbi:PREDICTED: protein TIFY 5A-like [Tarenaya hassleriana]|uniref:protein TIFY 5A-like n=1 Tax=Tarenaya hassleriana TaxID=28532 RepID=UPI00053C460A|nr:PREDICTED: protein TIFY 5A-like [Tarenaya hassleriana]
MERNYCDLELRLLSSSFDSDSISSTMEESKSSIKEEESQRMTIFYNGKIICISDITHLQAQAIISLANRGMEKRSSSRSSPSPHHHHDHHHDHHHHRHHGHHPLMSLKGYNSVGPTKKSLQRFLQKRRDRIQATCPYNT